MRTVSRRKNKDTISVRIQKNWFALWELTKRELKRKYARSYLGILWSIFYPLLRMLLVVFLFSFVFSKGIDRYPAYYFTGFLLYEFFSTATSTSLTCLKDNKDFLMKTKLPRNLLVLSRVLTAFVNMLLGFIPFILVLIIYKAPITIYFLWVPIILILYAMMVTGWSYILAIIYPLFPDIRNIHSNVLFILRFFVALFYSIEWVSDKVQIFIMHNPIYAFIKFARNSVVYGSVTERLYIMQIFMWGLLLYVAGNIIFRTFEQHVINKI